MKKLYGFLVCLMGMVAVSGWGQTNRIRVSADGGMNIDFVEELTGEGFYMCGNEIVKYKGTSNSPTIPDYVTAIWNGAFLDCHHLTEISIPNGVMKIGFRAFSGCTNLKSITIGEGVNAIGEHAFDSCFVASANFTNSCKVDASANNYWGMTIVGTRTDDGFCITEGKLVKYLGNNPSLTLPDGIKEVGANAFEYFHDMTALTVPASLTACDEKAFAGCAKVESIVWNSDATPYYINRYSHSALKSAELGTSVSTIGGKAFEGCSGLTSVVVPNSVKTIGESAFSGCSNMTSIALGTSVVEIGKYAFSGCSGLTHFVMPNSVKSIGLQAFLFCSGLEDITFSDNLTDIGERAFFGCSKIKEMVVPESVETIGEHAFSCCSALESISFGKSLKSITAPLMSSCTSLASISVDEGNPVFDSRNDCNAIISTASNTLLCGCKTSVVPESVTKIGEWAFFNCTGLTCMVLHEGVTEIADGSFSSCSGLKSVNIPSKVSRLGASAFEGCSALEMMVLPHGLTYMGNYAFYNCTGMKAILSEMANVPATGKQCFYGVRNCTLRVPMGCVQTYQNYPVWKDNFKEGNALGNSVLDYFAYSLSEDGSYIFNDREQTMLTDAGNYIRVFVPKETADISGLKYARTFGSTDNAQTLYVPMALDVTEDLGDFNVYAIASADDDGIHITPLTSGTTTENTPYIVVAKTAGSKIISVADLSVKTTESNTTSITGFEITGTYDRIGFGDVDGDWYAMKDGKFMKAGEGAYLNPYRFYLKPTGGISVKDAINIVCDGADGIEDMSGEESDGHGSNWFDIAGRKVTEGEMMTGNGIYIIDGKKVWKR